MLAVPKMHLPKRDDGVPIGGVGTDGWYRTGDLGQLDKNGRLTITGREDDLVKVDGKRVALGEVEGCLEAFPKIKAAQARVITDDLGGPMVVARVVRASMCRAEDIIDHCARNLAPYKVPRQSSSARASRGRAKGPPSFGREAPRPPPRLALNLGFATQGVGRGSNTVLRDEQLDPRGGGTALPARALRGGAGPSRVPRYSISSRSFALTTTLLPPGSSTSWKNE